MATPSGPKKRRMFPLKRRSLKVGQTPGSLLFVGDEKSTRPRVSVMDFGPDGLHEFDADSIGEVFDLRDSSTVSWINIDGVHDVEMIRAIGERFGIHPLVLEDIVNTGQRPKLEIYEDYLFVVVKMLRYQTLADNGAENGTARRALRAEQVSLLVGPNCVISFQEEPGDVFDPVRERIRHGRGRIRHMKTDYAAYALLDVIVDYYFVILEDLGALTEDLEEQVLDGATRAVQLSINDLRRDLIYMRRMVWPTRELFSQLERSESALIHNETRPFIRDAYDHSVQVIDLVESLRDVVSGLTDLYMTAISNRMNEVMKVLTIIGTIFIPLTFIAGIYGMNFEHMPELHTEYGYPVALTVMVLIGVVLLVFFRRKEWI